MLCRRVSHELLGVGCVATGGAICQILAATDDWCLYDGQLGCRQAQEYARMDRQVNVSVEPR